MSRIVPLDHLPENFDAFVDEIAPDITALYGTAAGQEYRSLARRGISANIVHPVIQAFAAMDGPAVVGMVIAINRGPAAAISFVHVLRTHAGGKIEGALIKEATHHLQETGAERIVSECIPAGATNLRAAFARQDYRRIARMLMHAPTTQAPKESGQVQRLEPAQWRAAAACIVAAYHESPDRRLHAEVDNNDAAYDYIARIATGNYGPAQPEFLCAAWRGVQCLGVALGCRTAPGVGFILQLAVHPEARGKGHGAALLQAVMSAFHSAGLARVALGVTRDNAAVNLYTRLRFVPLRSVDAYVWEAQDAQRD